MSTITIEIDGHPLEARVGEMLICVTDRNGIYIPRFCYHEKLSVAANCRMCLVEVERSPKPLPACATPVMNGMKVYTRSKFAVEAQKSTMEFLLINHPLDCPVCDQGGECPLQDQALGYGKDNSRFLERKRSVPSHNIGPLVATEMTRCIHCTRCVRFGEEVAGVMEIGAPGRGEHVRISTFLDRPIESEVSGNIIDLCPVGALTSKPFRFAARSWELTSHFSISPHDCLGTNINIQTLRGQVERVLPVENAEINECWLADRDRFSYQAINGEQRLTSPMIKQGGDWKEVGWEVALECVATGLTAIVDTDGTAQLGGLAAATSTLEEFHLFQKLLRTVGSENVDFRLQQCDFSDDDIAPAFPASEIAISDFDSRKSILLIGSNIRKEQPLLSLRIRKGWLSGKTAIAAINPIDYDLNFALAHCELAPGADLVTRLAALAEAIASRTQTALPAEISSLSTHADLSGLARQLCAADDEGLIIFGMTAQQHPDASLLRAIGQWIAETTNNKLAILAPGNSAAGALSNCQPGLGGKNARSMLESGIRGFILLGCEPELDTIDSKTALQTMQKAEFVVQLSAFKSKSVMQYADVLLPMTAFTETAGTFVNCEGRRQAATVASKPKGEARPAWKILRVLGNFLHCSGFDYITLDEVTTEIASIVDFPSLAPTCRLKEWRLGPIKTSNSNGLVRLVDMPMYRGEVTLRHAAALQQTADTPRPIAQVHPDTLQKHSLQHEDTIAIPTASGSICVPVTANQRIPENCIYIPAGFLETISIDSYVNVTPLKADQEGN